MAKSESEKDQEHIQSLIKTAQSALLAKYCENSECGVLLFQTLSNCPGCGQFGRIKGVQ